MRRMCGLKKVKETKEIEMLNILIWKNAINISLKKEKAILSMPKMFKYIRCVGKYLLG